MDLISSEPPASAAPARQEFILSRLPASRANKRAALVMVFVLVLAFLVVAGPLSTMKLSRVDAFIPMYAAAMFVNDAITAILLFAQYSILRSRSLLAIASGYLFTALMLVPWTLTFPGVFAPRGLLGAGLQSTAWVYLLWHGGFATFVIAYALLKDDHAVARLRRTSPRSAILASVAMTIFLVGLATTLVTAGDRFLPRIMADTIRLDFRWNYGAASVALSSVVALVVLWVRRRSVLDLCLMVVMCAVIIEVTLISFPVPARFSIGWYSGRIFGVLSGSLVLFVLL
ncbi:hypothetical protein AMOR_31940 [Anaeromyxobacter oryzae]|uniref:Membrane-associated sensor domain-containing protein n=2 Tax=Anaeromyxobacter oryzae TaxID=2918170 RepID=A0ABN6MXD8_9BACT|nr:hypothetical protein AMOR_31940 [Anaeromyxobacter oryzae]